MKKLFLLLALAFCGTFAFAEKSTQDIQIKEATLPTKSERPRSLLPYTEATVNYAAQCIEVRANFFLGELEITLSDRTGCTVYSRQLVPNDTQQITLPMPDAGMYRITFLGDEYYAEGEFRIE